MPTSDNVGLGARNPASQPWRACCPRWVRILRPVHTQHVHPDPPGPTPQGPDSHYGTKGLRKVTHESPTTGAKTCFTFCYAAGNNNGTSVEDGQIPEVIFYT